MLRRDHDPTLDVVDRGCFVLRRDSQVAGHVATVLGSFWSPFRPFTMQDWVWLLVVWADGDREVPVEDYAPWSAVAELRSGVFAHDAPGPRHGEYGVERLDPAAAAAQWAALGIRVEDF